METKKIIGCPELSQRLKSVQEEERACLPSYKYPDNIVTVSMISQLVNKGVSIEINKNEVAFCRGLDAQKLVKKTIFGSGFLVSDKVAKEKEAKEKEAKEKEAKKEVIYWELSEREKQLVKTLG